MMDAGVESPESVAVRVGMGIAMDIPITDDVSFSSPSSCFSSPSRIPRRLRRRLLVESKSPSSVEEIEAKLRHADLRRQQHYENLSCKARTKPRSPSHSSSNEEDLGQRLEAKLQAAEQKRLSILAGAQKRLARLDELRQAAKTGVEMRYEKEREKLGSKVESRVQQAEANRMLILKAYSQRRNALKERLSQSKVRRMAKESKYKERVRAAISQKRAAAERKRQGLLEAEKKRVRARVLQVRRVANSISQQREIERRQMRDQLEVRLQRAKRQRAEYLRHRGRLQNSVRVNYKQADLLARKLARCWRRFLRLRKTTLSLTEAYDTLKIKEKSVKSMPFEQLALLLESTTTLQTVKPLLERFESRLMIARAGAASKQPSSLDNIDHLLKRVATPKRKATPRRPLTKKREARAVAGSPRETARITTKLTRYPVRIVLCAYMILGHPDAVLSGQGECEIALAKSAEKFVQEFELLIKIILAGPIQSSEDEPDSSLARRWTFRTQLAAYDKAWCSYLNCFVVWKVKDAQSLEDDLVRAACQLELSMIQTCKLTPEGDSTPLTHDMKAILRQVTEDQKLLREKVKHLSGDAGIERMQNALSETRTKYFQAKENGSPVVSPLTQFASPSPSHSSASPFVASSEKKSNDDKGIERPSRIVRSLFREDDIQSPTKIDLSEPTRYSNSHLGSVEIFVTENELIVNEFLHQKDHPFSDSLRIAEAEHDSIKVKIKATMEKAFWDGILESVKHQDEVNYDRVIELVREVRDEICEMAPESWKQEINDAIDISILSQVLKSGYLDVDYLGRILEFALVTLQKLSAPAKDDEMKATRLKLLKELTDICHKQDELTNSCAVAMVKGLRFVLEQIQVLKQEISKARIRIMEPLLKGPAGLDYLRDAFIKRYGPPLNAYTSLPITAQWLSSVCNNKDHEWEEHINALSALADSDYSSQGGLPSTILRSGGSIILNTNERKITASPPASKGNQQPCNGGKIELLVRLGLLRLVSGVSGLTQEALPETLSLNLSRLRAVQAQIQKIIVITTSALVCRQTFLSERANPSDIESILSKCVGSLTKLLDRVEDAGIDEIADVISRFSKDGYEAVASEKLQSRKAVMGRVLGRCLQAGDAVFEKVSRAVYLGARGVVLGGSGLNGKRLAEMALRQVGAAALTERLVEAAKVLVVAATVSVNVHEAWYACLIDKIETRE